MTQTIRMTREERRRRLVEIIFEQRGSDFNGEDILRNIEMHHETKFSSPVSDAELWVTFNLLRKLGILEIVPGPTVRYIDYRFTKACK